MTVPRSRVFVSSVIEGFAEYRQAVRKGIEQASGEGILVNEDFPSQASSSRNTCLDAIDSCVSFRQSCVIWVRRLFLPAGLTLRNSLSHL
jgi:hypothetical protein